MLFQVPNAFYPWFAVCGTKPKLLDVCKSEGLFFSLAHEKMRGGGDSVGSRRNSSQGNFSHNEKEHIEVKTAIRCRL